MFHPLLLYDQQRTFTVHVTVETAGREGYEKLWDFVHSKGLVVTSGASKVYMDADVSRKGRVLLFTDKALKCVW
jgi:hypothetical protein